MKTVNLLISRGGKLSYLNDLIRSLMNRSIKQLKIAQPAL